MKLFKPVLLFSLFLCPLPLPADEPPGTLEKLLFSLVNSSDIIEAKKSYENSLLERKYRYLQWWLPSFTLSNDIAYPYEHDEFDDLAASNRTSLMFSAPLPTGSLLELTASYGLSRDMLTDMLPLEKWGFSQDLQGKIGVGQSLNPWWLHGGKNPYTAGAALRTNIAKNSYNVTIASHTVSVPH